MKIEWHGGPAADARLDALILHCFDAPEEAERLGSAASRWIENNAPWFAASGALSEFGAESASLWLVPGPSVAAPPRVLLAGLGKPEKFDADALRLATAAASSFCRKRGYSRVGIALPALPRAGSDPEAIVEELSAAANLGLYAYEDLKSEKTGNAGLPETLVLVDQEAAPELERAAELGEAGAAGTALARDLVNTPPNLATPRYLAQAALDLARRHGFKAEALEPERISELGMGAFMSVARGSAEPPRLAVVDTAPESGERPLLLIGKGVTFDTGGISIKPSQGMEAMKGDMAGAAAVIGALEALGRAGAESRVVALLPLAENMPGSKAARPGDVVRAYSGKTIEIISTDAEGRMLLCDALAYSETFSPAAVVDIATLTGACVVALGADVGALFCEDRALADALAEASEAAGERLWPMPMWDFYFKALTSEAADMKNAGDRKGGAIHAALFLKQFVPADAPWAHLDIAGPGFSDSGNAFRPKGGSGFGVRTLFRFARNFRTS
jgi:leucyl aminopeptidase